jgi:hypothetical protein
VTDQRNGRAYRALTGRSPRTEPNPAPTSLDFTASLNLLYGRVKSQTKLADILGVPRRTVRRWLAGEVPGRTEQDKARRDLVEGSAKSIIRRDDNAARQAVRRSRLPIKREAKVRAARTITIVGTLRYEGTERTMKFVVGDNGSLGVDGGAVDQLVDAYLNGASADDGALRQNDGIFAPIAYGLTDDWYREAFLDTAPDGLGFDVSKVTFT